MTTVDALQNLYTAMGGTGDVSKVTSIPDMVSNVAVAAENFDPGGQKEIIETIPSPEGSLTYDGTEQTPTWTGYDNTKMTMGGVTSATNVGTYSATFTPKAGYCWQDQTTSAKVVEWSIIVKVVTVPTVTGTAFTYDGTIKGPSITSYNPTDITITGNTATNAGSYTLTMALTDSGNTVWSDETAADKTTSWSIAKMSLASPVQDGILLYTGETLTATFTGYDSEYMTVTGNTASTVGTHTATFTLIDTANTAWADSQASTINVNWTISNVSITIPTVTDTSKTYTGVSQSPTITGLDTGAVDVTGDSATNAGSYTITFALKDKENTHWSDNTTADITASWSIAAKSVTPPTVTDTTKTYDTTEQSPTIASYDPNEITVTGDAATNAGSYTITMALANITNYVWSDTTTADKTTSWTISPKSVTPPTVTGTSFTYDGTAQGPTVSSYDTDEVTVTGDTATNAGSYTLTMALTSTNNYVWSDTTTADKTTSWSIAPISVTVPTVTGTSFTYDGTALGPTVGTFDPDEVTQGGTVSETNAGSYAVTFTLVDSTNTEWSDHTTAAKTVSWAIAKATMAIPAQSGSLTYNGTAQSPTWSNYDNTKQTIGGDTSGTNAGSYSATFTISDTNYMWSDDSTGVKTIPWTIGKATATLSINKNSVSLDSTTLSDTITATVTGDGTLSAVSSDTTVATVSVSSNVATITSVNSTTGSATITFSLSATTNYSAPSDVTASVTASFTPAYPSFANATDAELGQILDDAADGQIDLQQDAGWAVGDVRTISVGSFTDGAGTTHSQQDIDIVITSFDEYMSCGNLMQVDFKDALATSVRMNSTNTNVGGYGSSEMKTTTLPALVSALPSWMQSRMKTFSVLVSKGTASSTIETVTGNKLALRSEVELDDTTASTYKDEGVYVPYYASNDQRKKKGGHLGTYSAWWERSPNVDDLSNWRFVKIDGSANGVNGSGIKYCLAPFCCLGGATPAPTIVSFSSGTDAEIGAMIDAAQAGTIDLQQDGHWAVGDVRTITVGSFTDGAGTTHAQQDIDIVITSFDEYMSCGNVLQFDFKDALTTGARMNSTNTNVGGYGGTDMKTTTLPALVNALPSWLKTRLIEFSVLASAGNKSTTIETVTGNKLALRSEVELDDTTTDTYKDEGVYVPYYASVIERIKKIGHTGSAAAWWERSPRVDRTDRFRAVEDNGHAESGNYAAMQLGVAPFGCL